MNETSSRPLIGTFLVMLFVLEGIFIGGIFLFLNTQPWIAGAFISIGAPIMVVLVVTLALHLLWNRLTAPFPPQEVPHTADQRSFQSFSWGFVNMGLSINAAIDDEYLCAGRTLDQYSIHCHGSHRAWSRRANCGPHADGAHMVLYQGG